MASAAFLKHHRGPGHLIATNGGKSLRRRAAHGDASPAPLFPFSHADTGLPLTGSPAFSGVLALPLDRGAEPDREQAGGRMA